MFKNCILYNLYFYRFGMHWSALYIFLKIKSYHADLRAEIVLFIEVPAVVYAGFPADSKILRKQLPAKVLVGNLNPWQNPQENQEFLVVQDHIAYSVRNLFPPG